MPSDPRVPAPVRAERWAVGLRGGEWELGEVAPHFAGSIRISREADGWELTADGLVGADDAQDVLTFAREILPLINGLARIRLDSPDTISVGNVRRYRSNGTKDVFAFPETARARVHMGTPTVMVNGVVIRPATWISDIELAARDLKVQAVVAFLGMEATWHSLYAALDTVLKDRRTGSRTGAKRRSGVSEAKLKLFTATANSFGAVGVLARHGPGYQSPRTPMTLDEAFPLVAAVVDGWLAELGELST